MNYHTPNPHNLPVTMNGRKVGEVIEQRIGDSGTVYVEMILTDPGIASVMMEGLPFNYSVAPTSTEPNTGIDNPWFTPEPTTLRAISATHVLSASRYAHKLLTDDAIFEYTLYSINRRNATRYTMDDVETSIRWMWRMRSTGELKEVTRAIANEVHYTVTLKDPYRFTCKQEPINVKPSGPMSY